jgi:hypothetical protein
MNVLVAIGAEILPVAAIRRVVEVIPVLVMDGKQVPLGGFKISAAAGADQAVQGQRPLPVIFPGRQLGFDILKNLGHLFPGAGGPGETAGTFA